MRVRFLSTCKITSQPVLFHGKGKRPRGQTQRTSLVTAQQVGYFTFRLVTLVLKFPLRLGMTEVKGNVALFAGDSSLGDPNRPSKPAYPSPQRELFIILDIEAVCSVPGGSCYLLFSVQISLIKIICGRELSVPLLGRQAEG